MCVRAELNVLCPFIVLLFTTAIHGNEPARTAIEIKSMDQTLQFRLSMSGLCYNYEDRSMILPINGWRVVASRSVPSNARCNLGNITSSIHKTSKEPVQFQHCPNVWHKKHFAHNANTMAAMHANVGSRQTIPALSPEPLSE